MITIKTTPLVKTRAQKLAEEMGFALSSVVNGFLNHFIKERKIEFSADPKEEPTEYLLNSLKEAEAERQRGEVLSFNKPEDAVAYVSSLIKKR